MVRTALSGAANSGIIGDAINVSVGYADYKNAREQGNSKAVSVAKAAGSFAWGEFFYGGVSSVVGGAVGKMGLGAVATGAITMGATLGLTAVMAGGQIVGMAGQHTSQTMQQGYSRRGKFGSGYFDMTQAGYTMRQRSLNAIRSNGLNTQSAIGNEARTYYRGSL